MQRKFCVVAMRGDLDEFKEMIDFASVPEEKIGSMNSNTVLVSTFISNFSMFELEDLFKAVPNVNFFLMDVDNSGIFLESEAVRNSLMSVFNGFDERQKATSLVNSLIEIQKPKKTPEEAEGNYQRLKNEVEQELKPKLKVMSDKEKQAMIDNILDKMPDITTRDEAVLNIVSNSLGNQ